MSSQNSVSSVAPVTAAASGPVLSSGTASGTASGIASGTASATNSQPVGYNPVAYGMGKNISSRGKGGKLSALRHKSLGVGIMGFSRPRQRKIASRAGVKAMSKTAYEPNNDMVKDWILDFMEKGLCYGLHARRKTLYAIDAVAALNRMGITIYTAEPDR